MSLLGQSLKTTESAFPPLVERANTRSWFVAGENLVDESVSAYWVDIKITAGTNTKDETTALVQAAHRAMREVLGPVHEESYVLVHAVDGHAYGFGGRTQERRWSAAHPA